MIMRKVAMRHSFELACSAVLALGAWSGNICAQPSVASDSAQKGVTAADGPLVRGFAVTGANPLPDSEISVLLAPFLRKPATLENLQRATASLEAALRTKGFGLHRVVLPPQEVDETITLHLVQFTMGSVDVEGGAAFAPANIRASVPELAEGGTPNLERLAIQTALANENGSKHIQVSLRAGDQPDRVDATIKVQESPPLKFSMNLNNTGSKQSGRDRFTLAASHDNLFDRDHQFVGAYTTSLAKPSAVSQFGLTYRVPLYAQLSMLDVSYTNSDVVGDFGTFSSSGAGRVFAATVRRHLSAPQGEKRQLHLAVEDKTYEPTRLNGQTLTGQSMRRSRPLTLGYTASHQGARSAWDWHASLAVNLPGGSGNQLAAYRSESPSVDQTRWSALRARATWVAGVGDGWSLAWRGQAQWTPDALLAGEQLGLGGYTSLRGTEERALSGDSGLISSFEVGSPEWVAGMRWIVFWDAGWLSSHRAGLKSLPSHDRASSVGLSWRYTLKPVSFMLDYGRVVVGSKQSAGLSSTAPRAGDHKVHLSVTARF